MAIKKWVPEAVICKRCNNVFMPWRKTQFLCGSPCRSSRKLSHEEANANWINRDLSKRYKQCKNNFKDGQCRVI